MCVCVSLRTCVCVCARALPRCLPSRHLYCRYSLPLFLFLFLSPPYFSFSCSERMYAGRIEVYCRVKPTEVVDHQHLHFLPDHCTVQVQRPPRSSGKPTRASGKGAEPPGWDSFSLSSAAATARPTDGGSKPQPTQWFTFDGIFFDHSTNGLEGNAFGQGANTHENVYTTAVRKMLTTEGVLGGTSGTVLCYGAKGSGKSFTMFGSGGGVNGSHSSAGGESLGVVQRGIVDLYRGVAELHGETGPSQAAAGAAAGTRGGGLPGGGTDPQEDQSEFTIYMTVLQLQGERVADMLALNDSGSGNGGGGACLASASSSLPPSTAVCAVDGGRAKRVNISLDGKGEVVLKGVRRRSCPTVRDAIACLQEGLQAHRCSPQAGYCHLVVSFHIQQRNLSDSVARTRKCVLHFVDLAGTQSQRSAGDSALNAEERHLAAAVNQSLTMLQQVVLALGESSGLEEDGGGGGNDAEHLPGRDRRGAEGSGGGGGGGGADKPYIPYRQSKLTTLLKGAMGGRCMTTLIAHIKADRASIDATLHTLQFAKQSMCVVADPQANVTVDAASQVRHLQRQLTDLRAELRLQTQLSTLPPNSSSGNEAPRATSGGAARGAALAAAASAQQVAAPEQPLASDEVQQVHEKVHAFVDGNTPSLQVRSVREMQACFSFLRSLVEQKEVRVTELMSEVAAAEASAAAAITAAQSQQQLQGGEAAGGGAGGPGNAAHASGRNPDAAAANGSVHRSGSKRSQANGAAGGKSLPTLPSSANSRKESRGDAYAPSVLDLSVGVGYGVSARASGKTAAAPQYAESFTGLPSAKVPPLMTSSGGVSLSPTPVPPQLSHPVATGAVVPHNPSAKCAADSLSLMAPPRPLSSVAQRTVPPAAAAPANSGNANTRNGNAEVSSKRPQTAMLLLHPQLQGVPQQPARPATAFLAAQAAQAPPSAHSTFITTTGPLDGVSSRRRESTSDPAKTAAFEAYKLTPAGAAQLRGIRSDQATISALLSRQEELQARLEQVLAALQQRRIEEGLGSSGTDLVRPLTASVHADRPDSAGRVLFSPGHSSTRRPPGTPQRQPEQEQKVSALSSTRTARQLGAACHAMQEQLKAIQSERSHLLQQLDHRRSGLLRNFEEWHSNKLWESDDVRYQVAPKQTAGPSSPHAAMCPNAGDATESTAASNEKVQRQPSAGSNSSRAARNASSSGKRGGGAARSQSSGASAAATSNASSTATAIAGH